MLQLLPSLESGGVERGVLEVNHALQQKGHRSLVVSAGGRLVDELAHEGGEHFTMPIGKKSWRVLPCLKQLRQLIETEQPDIIHARSRLPAWVGYCVWQKMKKKQARSQSAIKVPRWITTCHGLHSVSRYSAVMASGETVIAVSETVRQYLLKHYLNGDDSKIQLIPRGVDQTDYPYKYQPSETWLNDWYMQHPQLREPFVIVISGRLTRLKGHFDFIQLIANLRQGNLNVHGLIVGDRDPNRTAYADSLEAKVKEIDLSSHITFAGYRSDIREVLAASDAVVSLSNKPESFGRAVLESIMLGKPTFGYDHGGVGEILSAVYPDGKVPLSDVDHLTQQLTACYHGDITNPQKTDRFTKQDMLHKIVTLYESLA